MNRIYLSPPDVGDLEAKYVGEALGSGWAAPAGPDLTAFESELANRVGVAHAVAVSSGTAALHLGLITLGVKAGDVVLTSTMTFAASAFAIAYVGARPHFVDCDRTSGNIDVQLLADAAREVRAAGHRIAAILPVDLLGRCADHRAIAELAAELDVPVLVDSAESLGASCGGRHAGAFGDASVLSFNGNKVMTTSGGGMLLTNSTAIADHARHLSTQARQPTAHYEHVEIGYNYRLSNILAALGRAQLARLDSMLGRRREIRDRYRSLVADIPGVSIFAGDDDEADNCWLTALIVDDSVTGWSANDLRAYLESENIESRQLWKPMHLQPVFAEASSTVNGNAEWLFGHGLALPSGSALAHVDLDRVVSRVQAWVASR